MLKHPPDIALRITLGCLLWIGIASATATADETPNPEFTNPDAVSPALADLVPELEFFVIGQRFIDSEMNDTYGLMPTLGVGGNWAVNSEARFCLSIGYGWTKGDPFHDTPDFDGGDLLELCTIPLTCGIRVITSRERNPRVNCDIAVQAIWNRERYSNDGESRDSFDSQIGFLFLVGPEWRLDDRDRGVGLQIGFTATGAHGENDPPLTGLLLKLYTVLPL